MPDWPRFNQITVLLFVTLDKKNSIAALQAEHSVDRRFRTSRRPSQWQLQIRNYG